jgi:hypothetical protein
VTLVGGSYTGVAGMRSDIDTGGGGSMTASLSPGLNYIAVIT